jgi:hypothetical protein
MLSLPVNVQGYLCAVPVELRKGLYGLAAPVETVFLITLVSSAMRTDLHLWACIKLILHRLLAGTHDYTSPCRHAWKQSHPESIRHARALERRDAADRKHLRRARRRIPNAESCRVSLSSG